ncbi:MAG: UvrB/UvrC motif-containing protein [Phycisphaerae bacterium]
MMCKRCNKAATVHIKEINNGTIVALDLCDQCAAAAGYTAPEHLSLNEILNEFVAAQSQVSEVCSLHCPDCGMTWQEFKDTGLLGCEKDYDIFVRHLEAVIGKAQRGAKHHTGKPRPPQHRDGGNISDGVQLRRTEINRLQRELAQAVAAESYEQAAKLRDQISLLEKAV